jgi:hypothetical protein
MQTLQPLTQQTPPSPVQRGRRRFSTTRRHKHFFPFMIIGVAIMLLIVIGAGASSLILPHFQAYAAGTQPNMDCTIIVPPNPLSAKGLATPYQLTSTDPAQGSCNEVNSNQSAFVQAAILAPATGKISVYSPLVIDQGTQPAIPPTVPQLPRGAVVGIWFGFNGNNLTLLKNHRGQVGPMGRRGHMGLRGDLAGGHCVNGLNGSLFGQFSYCNAPAFFQAAHVAIRAGKLTIPPLGTAKDGQPCPTTRDFSVVDQDQSDNVQTQYLADANGLTAQFTAANQGRLQHTITNPSDNRLLTNFIDPALGCQPLQAPDLADSNAMVSALALDELQAEAYQRRPIALVPLTDPMTLVNNNPSLAKTNLYRIGVDQIPTFTMNQASGTVYCRNLVKTGLPRIKLDMALTSNTSNATSPAPDVANSLFTFLALRFNTTYTILNCAALLNIPNPVTLQMDENNVVTAATTNTGK